VIRSERDDDHAAVHALNVAAFGSPAEANLVDRLRREAHPHISLVAEVEGTVFGHIMFTPVVLSSAPNLRMMGLAPMAVASTHRRRGIGAALIHSGLGRCTELAYGAVVVLGHPSYYPRFGFKPAMGYGLSCEYDAPREAFMVIELKPSYLSGVSGEVVYHEAF